MLRKGNGGLYKAPKRKKEVEREIRSSLWILDLKDGKLWASFHKLDVLGMNDDLWERVRGLGSETWKVCE